MRCQTSLKIPTIFRGEHAWAWNDVSPLSCRASRDGLMLHRFRSAVVRHLPGVVRCFVLLFQFHKPLCLSVSVARALSLREKSVHGERGRDGASWCSFSTCAYVHGWLAKALLVEDLRGALAHAHHMYEMSLGAFQVCLQCRFETTHAIRIREI